MNSAALLWIIGVLCLMAAIFGKAIKVMGNELPGLSSTAGRVFLAVLGVVSISLGFAANSGGSSTPGGATTTATGGGGGQGSAAPPTNPPVQQGARTWRGSITDVGVDFDYQTPHHVADYNISASGSSLTAGTTVLIAEWTTQRAPGSGDCREYVRYNSVPSVSGVVVGTQVCVLTHDNHVAYLQVTKVDRSSGIEVDATVWDK